MTLLAAPPLGDEVDRRIVDILDRPAFDGLEDSLFEQVRERVLDYLARALGSVFGGGSTNVVAIVLFALALALLVWLMVRVFRQRSPATAVAGEAVEVVVRTSPGEWMDRARAARRAGDLAGAARFGYRAVVAALDARGLVEDVDGRTVGEHRATLSTSGAGPLRDGFETAATVFERVHYGGQDVGDDDLVAVEAAARDVGVRDA